MYVWTEHGVMEFRGYIYIHRRKYWFYPSESPTLYSYIMGTGMFAL